MTFEQRYLIAITELNGKCVEISHCRTVSEKELNKLLNEKAQHEQEIALEKQKLQNELNTLKDEISVLKHEIRVLKGEDDDE